MILSLKPFSRAGLGLAPRRREHERNLHQRSAIELKGVDNEDDDIYIMMIYIYIMMQFCLFVTKNHHFFLGVSCDHLNYP